MIGFSNLYEQLLHDLTDYVYDVGEKEGNKIESITGILSWNDKCRYYKIKNKDGIIYIDLRVSLEREGNNEKLIQTYFNSINKSNLPFYDIKTLYEKTVKDFLEFNNICK